MTCQITLADYWMGRDVPYAPDLTESIRDNAEETVKRVNALLFAMAADHVAMAADPRTGSLVASGWRPPAINQVTRGAAPGSRHMTGQACDVFDPIGELDKWAMSNQGVLKSLGLWLEHPSATLRWMHVQTVPPKSGNRVFFP